MQVQVASQINKMGLFSIVQKILALQDTGQELKVGLKSFFFFSSKCQVQRRLPSGDRLCSGGIFTFHHNDLKGRQAS